MRRTLLYVAHAVSVVGSSGSVYNVYCATKNMQQSIQDARMTLRSLAISKGQSAKRTRSKEKAARMGARQLFKQLDGCDIPGTPSDGPADGIQHAVSRHESGMLQQSGDNVLTEAELCDGLVAADMLIPLELFSSLFKEIDSSGDGAISIAEFAEFVASTEPWPAGEAHRAALGAL